MEAFMSQTLSVLFLLVVSSFTYILSRKIRFPYTVLLVFVGLLLVPISKISFLWFVDDFKLTPNILFFVLLPILLFESAYNTNYRQLILNWKSISFLAIFGFLISAFWISLALFFVFPLVWFEIPYLVCLLFWSLISATDPVAVLSIFKRLWAPRRLTTIFEWESLFNDGTAVALFLVVLGIIMHGWDFSNLTIFEGIWKFLSMLFGGILFWTFTWVLFSKVIWNIKNNEEVEIILTMLVAHITFIFAEIITHFFPSFPISGVISTVIASIVIWNYGRYKITPRVEVHMQKFWEFFSFIANSLVFILIGLVLSREWLSFWVLIFPIIVTIIVVSLMRVVSVVLPISILNKFKLEENIPKSRVKLLSWWSLRGALALVMVLLIPGPSEVWYESVLAFQNSVWWSYDFSIKEFILIITISCIMFTLFLKATTTSYFMRFLWVDKLHSLEEFEYHEGKILSNLKIIQKLNNSYKKAYLTKVEYEELKGKYTLRLNEAAENMKNLLEKNKKDSKKLIKKAISLHALWIEKQYLKELFFYNEIDERNFKYILRKIDRQVEKLEYTDSQFKTVCTIENDYDIFSKFVMKLFQIKSTKLDSYIRNRSRVIITRKVIKELKYLSEIDFWFDKDIFEEVIELYSEFNKKADEKRIAIFLSQKATINAIESRLINKSLLKLEEKTINDLYHKEIITPKIYVKFKSEIEKEIFSDVKRFL